MEKMIYDKLLEKIPNKYLLAVIAGKVYKRILEKNFMGGMHLPQEQIIDATLKEVLETDYSGIVEGFR